MKKIRILAVILAVLMLPMAMFVACNKDGGGDGDQEYCIGGKHSYLPKEVISKRTCTTPLIEHRKCSKCSYVDIKEQAARGHAPTGFVYDKNATCTEDGTQSETCSFCNEYRETKPLPGSALGHNFITYTKVDDFQEMSVCHRCGKGEDYRLTGLDIDFEGDRTAPSYEKMTVFTDVEAVYNQETVGETTNSFLTVTRGEGNILGSTEFGVILYPRADVLQGVAAELCPSYVVEFSIRIKKDETKNLILLQGSKDGVKETFLTYDSEAGTVNSNEGPVYALTEEDFGAWLDIAVRLNDGKKVYEVYVNNKIVTSSFGSGTTAISYVNDEAYFMGFSLESLKIAMEAANGVASTFDIDNIQLYVSESVHGYENETNIGYKVYTADSGEKIVYKASAEGCSCVFTPGTPVAATCTTVGYTIGTCDVCGGQNVSDIVAATSHTWTSVSTVPATCTVDAYENFVCEKCDARNIEYVKDSKLGHKINTDVATGYKIVAPHCLAEGWTEGVCERCEFAMKIDIVEPLGHELDPSKAVITAATCTTEGYSKGVCIRHDDNGDIAGCKYTFDKTDVVEALGHTCANPVVTEATCTEGGYSSCICDRETGEGQVCGVAYTADEVPALGHVAVSVIKVVDDITSVVTACTRCGEEISSRPVLAKAPTHDEMVAMIDQFGIEEFFTNNAEDLHFENMGVGSKIGDQTQNIGDGARVMRYAEINVKYDEAIGGNYGQFVYRGNVDKIPDPKDSSKLDSDHAYIEAAGADSDKTFVFEISVRFPSTENKINPMYVDALDTSNTSGNAYNRLFNLDQEGNIIVTGGVTIGKVVKEKWTRIAVVYHANNGTSTASYDIYLDGVLVAKNFLGKSGTVNYTDNDDIRGYRVQFNTVRGAKIDIDEIYAYYADMPLYVTDVTGHNYTGFVFADTSLNTAIEGSDYSYIKADAIPGTTLTYGANTVYSVQNFGTDEAPEYGVKIDKNANTPLVPGSAADKNPELKTSELKTFSKLVYETDIKIGEGTASFDLLSGRKDIGGARFYAFLSFDAKTGKLVSAGTDICDVKFGEWMKVAVVVDEGKNTYEIYIDGVKASVTFNVSKAYRTDGTYTSLTYKFFYGSDKSTEAVYDISYKNTTMLGGFEIPNYITEGELIVTPPAVPDESDEPDDPIEVPDVMTKVPTSQEMDAYFNKNNNKLNNGIYNFDNDTLGTIRGSNDKIGEAANGFTGRYGTLATKADGETNRYGELYYTPGNCTNDDGVHTYFDITPNTAEGKDVVVEISFRKTEGADLVPFAVTVIDRSNKHASGMITHQLITVSAAGEIKAKGSDAVIGKVTEGKWTRVAVVVHTKIDDITTMDVYVDGKLEVKNIAFSRNGFDLITNVRFEVNDQKKTAPDRKLDIDEVYAYYASKPWFSVEEAVPEFIANIQEKGGTVIAVYDFEQDEYVAGSYIGGGGKSALYAESGAASNFKDADKNFIKIVEDANGNKYYQYSNNPDFDDAGIKDKDHYFDIMFCSASGSAALAAAQSRDKIGASFVFTMDFMPGSYTGGLVNLTTRHSSGQWGDTFAAVKVAGNVLQDVSGKEIATLTEGEFSTVAVLFVPGKTTAESKYYVYVNGESVTPDGIAFLGESWMTVIKDADGDGVVTTADYVPNHIRLAQTTAIPAGDDMAFDNIAIYYADTYLG